MGTDRYAYMSRLRMADPVPKIWFSLAVLIVCLMCDSIAVGVFTLIVMAALTASLGGQKVKTVLRFLRVPLAFLVIGCVTIVFRPIGEGADALEKEPGEEPGCSVYVLSNCIRNFGAAAVLYRNVLKNIGKYLEEDFYVLPSSVHEVIIVPDSSAPSWQETAAIVKEINETQVREEEVLSDVPYHYRREEDKLAMPPWAADSPES